MIIGRINQVSFSFFSKSQICTWPGRYHMLVSKTNSFSRGQVFGFGARIAIFTISRVKNLSTAGPCTNLRFREERKETWLTLPVVICLPQRLIHSAVAKYVWIWCTDCNFYHFPCKEFINGRAMDKFEILRKNERKPQPQVAWPVAMFIKDNHLKSSRHPRTETSFPGQTGLAGTQACQF